MSPVTKLKAALSGFFMSDYHKMHRILPNTCPHGPNLAGYLTKRLAINSTAYCSYNRGFLAMKTHDFYLLGGAALISVVLIYLSNNNATVRRSIG